MFSAIEMEDFGPFHIIQSASFSDKNEPSGKLLVNEMVKKILDTNFTYNNPLFSAIF